MSDIDTLLPPTTPRRLRRDLEIVMAERIEGIRHPLRQLWNPATCPVDLLPWLAWAFSVDEWDADWPEATKRAAIAASISIHRRKGTVASVREALRAFGYGDAQIIEGGTRMVGADWQVGSADVPVGGPSHWAEYWVVLLDRIEPKKLNRLAAVLRNIAPARCRLTRVTVENATVAIGGDWAVGTADVPVGATYKIGEYQYG